MSIWDEAFEGIDNSSVEAETQSRRTRKDADNSFVQFLAASFGRSEPCREHWHSILIDTLPTFTDVSMNGVSFDVRKVKRWSFPRELQDTLLQKHEVVVVKHPKLCDDEASGVSILDEIASELRILSHSGIQRHENILELISVVYVNAGSLLEPQILPALVVEYAEFGNITDFQSSGLCVTIQDKYDMCHDVAVGLNHLHCHGVIHADVKASNMLVCKHPVRKFIVKLSDFGFAFLTSDENPQLRGLTPYWAAPEALKPLDRKYLCQLDIYSYGLLMFNILRNGVNFHECDPVFRQPHMLRKVKETNLLPDLLEFSLLSTVNDRCLLLTFCKIVRYCLRANPSERFQSMGHILEHLVGADPSVLTPHEGDDVPQYFYNARRRPISYYFDVKTRLLAVFKQQLESFSSEVGGPLASALKGLYLKRMISEIDMIMSKPKPTDTERYDAFIFIDLQLWLFIHGISVLGRPHGLHRNKFGNDVPLKSGETSKIRSVTGSELHLPGHRISLQRMHANVQSFIYQQLQAIASSLKEPENRRRVLYNLAFCCIEGIGTTFDVQKGLLLVQEAAELGDLDAQQYMSQICAADSQLAQENGSKFVEWASNLGGPRVVKAMRQHHSGIFHELLQPKQLASLIEFSYSSFKISEWKILFLHFGATMNMGPLVRQLLDGDSSLVDCRNSFGQTPLIASCQAGSYEATLEILSHGADINAQDNTGFTALHWLVSFTDEQKIVLTDAFKLKAPNANLEGVRPRHCSDLPPNLRGGPAWTGSPLIWAIALLDESTVDALLMLGADPFTRLRRVPYTPLEFACLMGATDCVLRFGREAGWKEALSRYHELNKTDRVNALYWALENVGRWQRVQFHGRNFEAKAEMLIKALVEGGVSCEAVLVNETQRMTAPYAVAKIRCDSDIMRAGLNHGFLAYLDVTCDRTSSGGRPMLVAIANRDYDMFDYLVRAGASCTWENFDGCSALLLAAQASDDTRFVKTLLDTGGMAVDETKSITPFFAAVWHGNLRTARYLWDRGAKRDTVSKEFARSILGELILLHTKTVLPRIQFLLGLPDRDGSDGFCGQESTSEIGEQRSLLHLAVNSYKASEPWDENPEEISRCQLNLSLLLEKYSAPKYLNSTMGPSKATPLATAVMLGNQFAVQMLLEAGADPNIKDQYNTSPTDWALYRYLSPETVNGVTEFNWADRREMEKKLTAINHNTAAILSLLKSYDGQTSLFPLSKFNLSNWHDLKIGFADVDWVMNSKHAEAPQLMEQNNNHKSSVLGVDQPQIQSSSTALAESKVEE